MATNDKESSAAGTDNRPPMLEESDFESWKIHIERYIRGKPLGKLIWKSIKNGPTPHLTITVTTGEGEQQTQVTREKIDEEFTEAENNKERADIQATNILSKYVTIVKNSKDISTVSYVDLYTHLKSYEQTLSKMNQTSRNVDPLAYMAQETQSTSSPSQYVPPPPQYAPAPQQAPQSTNDAMLATMNQIVNLLSGFQKQVPPTNNQLKTSTNLIKAGHVAKECKEKKRAKDSQWFKDKAFLMKAKKKGAILDVETKTFLADVECTTPYDEPLAITTTTEFEGTSTDTDFHSEVQTYDNHFFDNMNLQVSQEIHRGELLDSNVDSVIDDHDDIIPYHQYQLNNEVESVPTDVSSVVPGGISVINILDDLRIKNDRLKDDYVSIKKRYQDLYQSKAESNSNVSSRAAVPEKPKGLAPGLYAMTPKFSKKPLTSYKSKDRKLKDISTGSPPNAETKAVND
nr:hypothetical protein [Tanacetum cinerariifolium]